MTSYPDGSIAYPVDSIVSRQGANTHVNIVLKRGYKVVKVVDNGVPVDLDDLNIEPLMPPSEFVYTIENIQEDHTVEVFCECEIQRIIFDSNGGDYTPPVQELPAGEVLVEPAAPQRDGYTFKGWYFDGGNMQFGFPDRSFYDLWFWKEESYLVAK